MSPDQRKLTKISYLVERRPDLAPEQFAGHWTTTHAGLARTMPGLCGYEIDLPSQEQQGPPGCDGYAVLWFESRDAAKAAWASEEGRATAVDGELFMAATHPLMLDEVHVIEPPARDDLFKVIYLVTRRAGLAHDDFVQHWLTTHATLAEGMGGLLGYAINLPSPDQRTRPRYDGYAALWFESRDAAKAAWASEEGRATAADGGLFMQERPPAVVVREITVSGTLREGRE